MELKASLPEDRAQIEAWMAADIDPGHHSLGYEFWLTGAKCFLACKLQDEEGDAAYIRIDHEDDGFRLHIQFAPEEVVSKRRVIVNGIEFIRLLVALARQNGKKFVVTESAVPKLVGFMKRLGFKDTEQPNNYVLKVE